MSELKNTSWGGRFSESTDEFVKIFTASVDFDQKMALEDIRGSLAHAQMLEKQGILSTEDFLNIQKGLEIIKKEIAENRFNWSVDLEDVHMNIERRLTDLIGEAGKKLHTGRSRNDQVATDIRLYLRAEIEAIREELKRLMLGIVNLAETEANTIMSGFTHLQTAQPISFGHHLMAWYEMLKRDFWRFGDCKERLNFCPLGAAALAGTTYPIDRNYSAFLLEFTAPCANSLDAVSDRDFAIEFSSCSSILLMHLSRMAEEMILWNSAQFKFIELPDRFCTGSSIMPQKKNPDVCELVRGKSGRVYGHLMALLTLMKSQPLAYNKDNQEDKEPLFDCVKTVKDCLRAFADMIPNLEANRENMLKATKLGFSNATDFADYLVGLGIAFRDAHEIVGKAVAEGVKNNCGLEDLKLEFLQTLCPKISSEIYEVLKIENCLKARNHLGSTAPEQVLIQVKKAKEELFC